MKTVDGEEIEVEVIRTIPPVIYLETSGYNSITLELTVKEARQLRTLLTRCIREIEQKQQAKINMLKEARKE